VSQSPPLPQEPQPKLYIVCYHYVRPIRDSGYQDIKGLELTDFGRQLAILQRHYEVIDLHTALAFLQGQHQSSRHLCLLTFDDGLRDHYEHVLPLLSNAGLSGVFFLITSALEHGRVVDVHKHHFLTAKLGLDAYRARFAAVLARKAPGQSFDVDPAKVARTYRFDDAPTAAFKYLINFVLSPQLKSRILGEIFGDVFGDEEKFSRALYLQWDEAQAMQDAGMSIGGHSHSHQALATLPMPQQHTDLARCAELLAARLRRPASPSFCYPYGKDTAYTDETIASLKELRFSCAFTTERGVNAPGADLFRLRRFDTNDVSMTN